MKNNIFRKLLVLLSFLSLTICSSCGINIEVGNKNDPTNPDDGGSDNGSSLPSQGGGNVVVVPESWDDVCAVDAAACPVKYTGTSTEYATIKEAYDNTVKSVVTIEAFVGGTKLGLGSGIIYANSSDGEYVYIITNGHVVTDDQYTNLNFEVIYHNDLRVKAESIVADKIEDIAIVKAKKEPNNDYAIAKLGDSDEVQVGEQIYTIGSPIGLQHNNNLTSGVISGVNVSMSTDDDQDGTYINMYMLQFDAAISSGNSGGPLFNMKGEVIGINTLKMTKSGSSIIESFNFAIRINKAIKVANIILEQGYYKRPLVGITVVDLKTMSLSSRKIYGISEDIHYGLYVESVVESGAVWEIIETDKIITHINGIKITGMENFSVELLEYQKGDTITLTVINRDGSNQQVKNVTLK